MLRCRPQALALNCNSTRMSVLDLHGVLSFYDFHVPPQQPGAQGSGVPTSGEHLAAERKVRCLTGIVSIATLVYTPVVCPEDSGRHQGLPHPWVLTVIMIATAVIVSIARLPLM